MSMSDYWRMFDQQAGVCAMPSCLRLLPAAGRADIDHCRQTGPVRGLLCHRCNVLEGQWREAERLGVREYLGLEVAA
jgi:hypothetical protein